MLLVDGCFEKKWMDRRCKNSSVCTERESQVDSEWGGGKGKVRQTKKGRRGEKDLFTHPQHWCYTFLFTHLCPSLLSKEALLCPYLAALASHSVIHLSMGHFVPGRKGHPSPYGFTSYRFRQHLYPTPPEEGPTLISQEIPLKCLFSGIQCPWETSIMVNSVEMTEQSSQMHEQFSKYLWS